MTRRGAKRRPSVRAARRSRRGSSRAWGWLLGALGVAGVAGTAVLVARQVQTPGLAVAAMADAGARPDGPSAKVKITFQTVPPVKGAEVRWGKKRLGVILGPRRPFILERPRDSGPIDVVVKADGYIPVNTRAYTFDDNKVFVKLTPVAEKNTLFGYKIELPDAGADVGAGAGAGADAGGPGTP